MFSGENILREAVLASGRILDYRTNSMKSGDPNGEGLPLRRPCRTESNIQILGG